MLVSHQQSEIFQENAFKITLIISEFVDKKNDLPLVELLLNDEYDARGESNVYEEFTFFAAAVSFSTNLSWYKNLF